MRMISRSPVDGPAASADLKASDWRLFHMPPMMQIGILKTRIRIRVRREA
jgi:hypothetical protein